jgi:hypothetical protein
VAAALCFVVASLFFTEDGRYEVSVCTVFLLELAVAFRAGTRGFTQMKLKLPTTYSIVTTIIIRERREGKKKAMKSGTHS